MTNEKDLLKEYRLEDMHKRFQQIVEYTFITSPTLSEDDEDNVQANNDITQTGDNQQNNNNDAVQTGGNEQNDTNNDDAMQADNQQNNTDEEVPNFDEPPIDNNDSATEVSQMQDGDEVIDVDDITNSQEEIEYKVDGVDDKLLKIAKVINKLIPAIEDNNNKIEDLKKEFEKRNPTEEEKINLRSQDSYPYSVKPKEYWDEKQKNSNYDITYDNSDKEYVLKKQDLLKNGNNDIEIYKSFNIPNQMSDYFNLY